MSPLERVREMATRVASAYGLDIFDVEMKRERGQQVLRVILDRPGPASTPEESVSIGDCARVAEELGTMLDVEDVVPGEYTFEVSSPGLDRPLKKERDFVRFAGQKVRVKVRVPVEGQRNFVGVLGDTREGKVALEVEGKTVVFDLANLDKARLVPVI